MNKIIEIKNIYVDYDNDPNKIGVINDVSFDINENEFVCILGPSGCGKSTLLKAVAGFIAPIKGKIFMDNEEVVGPDKKRGVVFQEPNLFPWFTVKDNIIIGPKMDKKPAEELDLICDKFLKQVELSEYKDTKVFELSGGQKQRVAIARTLANNPEVMLMDEPFGALDSFTRAKMQKMLRRIWKENKTTILFITHDIEEALLLGTKIFIMKTGERNIVKEYNIDFTHRLIKNPEINLLEDSEFLKIKKEITSMQ